MRSSRAVAVALVLGAISLSVRADPQPAVQRQAVPQRIISLVPAVTEMLFAIGAGDAVVGVSSYETFPPEALTRPKVGALVDPDFERILTLRPDLVIVYESHDELMRRLDRASIPYYRYRHSGLADVTATLRELGARAGHLGDAERAATRIEAELAAVQKSVAGRRRPRTALLFGREPGALRGIYASGGVGFLHDLLLLAGAENAFADIARPGVQVTTEMLLARAPEAIVEIRAAKGWNDERRLAELAVWRTLPGLPAVKNNRVHLLTEEALSIPGPRVIVAARALASALHAIEFTASAGPAPAAPAGTRMFAR
jgi:iron complex transport system substrate-binding protein